MPYEGPEFDEKRKQTFAKQRRKKQKAASYQRGKRRESVLLPIKTMQVIPYYLTGWQNKDIAEECDMTERVVQRHIAKYAKQCQEHDVDMSKFQENLRRDAMPLAREALLANLAQQKERTTLEFMDRMKGFPDKHEDTDAMLKGQAPEALVFTLIEKLMAHPIMGPRLLAHVQQLAERTQEPETLELTPVESNGHEVTG